jgi:hypothetical protein
MISISTICNDSEREKIAKSKEEKKAQNEIDYEAKEFQGSYADDDREGDECQ